jgi:SRSO17 transposase
MQWLFTTARWDAGGVRDDVRGYVAAALGSPDGVLIGDDTGFEKGGCRPAGVQRQYTGTAGKITNCQLGVFLAYASPKGRALVDRELYLPRSWTGDGQRLAAAGVPEGNWVPDETAAPAADDRARGHGRDPVRLGHG